jgi:glycine cleavage system aminomethyltransferase T
MIAGGALGRRRGCFPTRRRSQAGADRAPADDWISSEAATRSATSLATARRGRAGVATSYEITGPDAFAFTNLLVARDLAKCEAGQCKYVFGNRA